MVRVAREPVASILLGRLRLIRPSPRPLQVRSELCAPIFAAGGSVIGIIDAESFKPDHFSGSAEGEARADAVLAACARLGEAGLLVHMLP